MSSGAAATPGSTARGLPPAVRESTLAFVMAEVLSGVIRGSGEAMVPMVIYICGMCLFRLVWVLVVMKVFQTIQSVVWCYPASWTITALVFIIYYFKGNWLSRHHKEIAPEK